MFAEIARHILFAEIIAALTLGIVLLFFLNRRKVKQRDALIGKLREEIETLSQNRLRQSPINTPLAPEFKAGPIESGVLTQVESDTLEQIAGYQRRIANLEKFKQLFFKAEEHMAHYSRSAMQQTDTLAALLNSLDLDQAILSAANTTIKDIQNHLRALCPDAKRSDSLHQPEVETKKTQTADLSSQLIKSERIINNLKKQIAMLEAHRFGDFTHRDKAHKTLEDYDAIKRRMKKQKEQLDKKKQELSLLESEYENLFTNFQLLNQKDDTKHNDKDAHSSQNYAEIEKLKAEMAMNRSELARKEAEYILLEQNYMDLVSVTESLAASNEELERTKIEMRTLEKHIEDQLDLERDQSFEKAANEMAKRYSALEKKYDEDIREIDQLRERSKELERLQIEYTMLEKHLFERYEKKYDMQ